MRVAHLVLSVLIAAAIPLGAQPAPPQPGDDPLAQLVGGRWEGTGTILGQSARVALTVEPVLDGRFTRLLWVSHIGAAPRTQRFEGHAYYHRPRHDAPGGDYRATWFDSSGAERPITARRDGEAIVASWGSRETELGETAYRRLAPDRLEVVDRVLGKTGSWREFGRCTLTRLP